MVLGENFPTSDTSLELVAEKPAQYAVFTYHGDMSDTQEQAVRSYLAFLADPGTADRELVAELENQLSTAENPIAKLRVLAAIQEAKTPNRVVLEAAFVRHASEWAAENKIPANAFLALGVEKGLLTKAGFAVGKGTVASASKSAVSRSAGSKAFQEAKNAGSSNVGERKPRAKSVSSETVESLILETKGPFSVRDIVRVSQATNATVSRVMGVLVASKLVEKIGLLPPQGARGAAPHGYQVRASEPTKAKRKAGRTA